MNGIYNQDSWLSGILLHISSYLLTTSIRQALSDWKCCKFWFSIYLQKNYGCLPFLHSAGNTEKNKQTNITHYEVGYLELLCSDFVVDHQYIIVVEGNIAKYKTIQGNSEGPDISSLHYMNINIIQFTISCKEWSKKEEIFNCLSNMYSPPLLSRVLSQVSSMNRTLSDVFGK